MPRGVYDRSKSKRAAKSDSAPKTKRPYKRKAQATASTSGSGNRFDLLRTNIQALAGVLSQVGDDASVRAPVRTELLAELELFSSLRREVFGSDDQEGQDGQDNDEPVAQQSSVPLPPAPTFAPPPVA